jgi:hypothetical protein
MGGPIGDTARSERYGILGDALYLNPDLRFPNLDKVLPLPPAPLPRWDGNKQSLIDAAKAVVPTPGPPLKPAANAASQRVGRAHVPEDRVLPEQPQAAVPAQYETTAAPIGGYWLAQLMSPRGERHGTWNAEQLPMRYAIGELFDRTRPGLHDTDGRVLFHYVGEPVARPTSMANVDPRVARGIAREVARSEPRLECLGNRPCPATGIWQASVADDHPMAAVFNQWNRQSYVMEAQAFPDPREKYLEIRPGQVTWYWWGEANQVRAGDIVHVSVGDPDQMAFSAPQEAGRNDRG